eukprot:gene26228-32142_t
MKRPDDIKAAGYNLEYIWESAWDETVNQLKLSEIGKDLLERQKLASPIVDRDVYHGGRVDLGKLYYEVNHNEHIRYLDYNS